ncbi:hypothetical protein RP20_CCG014252 [Aedes albopictus]|nr:hypothetical protein RP20_CCG014252 [Aedes albopictus]
MSDCLTCAKSIGCDDQSFAVGANQEIQNALCKHFWFGDDQYLQGVLCFPCWQKIEAFHRFYCEVRKLHARPLCYPASIGLKQESQPVDFVLEVPAEQAGDSTVDDFVLEVPAEQAGDDTVVENGKIYSIKYENPQVDVAPEPSEQQSENIEPEDDGGVNENEADKPRPSKKWGEKRPRLRKSKKDAVQEYVSRNLTLTCDICSERSESFELLQRHSMMEHDKTATVECCNAKFSDASRFVNHIQYHLDPDLFKCEHCSKQCITRYALKKHLRMNHNADPDKPMSVKEEIELSVMRTEDVDEGPSGAQKSDASEHMNTSEDEDDEDANASRQNNKKFKNSLKFTAKEKAQVQMFVEKNRKLDCDMCSERYSRFKDLQKHSIEKHSMLRTGLCCNRKFRENSQFVAHILHHINPERFKCTECTRICPSWPALIGHMQWMHTPGGKKKYPCPVCEQKFRTRPAAMRHAEQHGEPVTPTDDDVIDKILADNFNLQCDTCQKQYDSYRALQKHSTAEHAKLVVVTCCKKRMCRPSELVDHYKYHQDPTAFTCKICLKPWHSARALRRHLRNTHGISSKRH